MAEHHEPHRFLYAVAMRPEKLLPAELAHEEVELFVGADHEGTAFVENGEEVAQPAALAALVRNRRRVHGVDARLGAREGEPADGIEPVVEIVGSRLDPARLMDAQLVGPALTTGGDEVDLPAALGANAGGCRVELLERSQPQPALER